MHAIIILCLHFAIRFQGSLHTKFLELGISINTACILILNHTNYLQNNSRSLKLIAASTLLNQSCGLKARNLTAASHRAERVFGYKSETRYNGEGSDKLRNFGTEAYTRVSI